MITYADRAFCTRHCLNSKCSRCVTPHHRKRAKEIGLPFALMDMEKPGCGYKPGYLPDDSKGPNDEDNEQLT